MFSELRTLFKRKYSEWRYNVILVILQHKYIYTINLLNNSHAYFLHSGANLVKNSINKMPILPLYTFVLRVLLFFD